MKVMTIAQQIQLTADYIESELKLRGLLVSGMTPAECFRIARFLYAIWKRYEVVKDE